jgi:hypothetical protein
MRACSIEKGNVSVKLLAMIIQILNSQQTVIVLICFPLSLEASKQRGMALMSKEICNNNF